MRKRTLLFLFLFSISSIAGVKSVAASTDCDKWLKQYRDELANAAPVQSVKHHIHHLVHRTAPPKRTVVAAIPPVHKPVVPKLTPAEMLRRFHILCDTPTEEVALTPEFTPGLLEVPTSIPLTEIATALVPALPGAPPVAPALPPVATVTPVTPPGPIGAPTIPILPGTPGAPGTPVTPGGPGGPGGSTTPVVPPVPEPASLALMLTGVAGIAVRRFRKA